MEDQNINKVRKEFEEYLQECARKREQRELERDRRYRRIFWLCATIALALCWTLIIYGLMA